MKKRVLTVRSEPSEEELAYLRETVEELLERLEGKKENGDESSTLSAIVTRG